MINLNFNPNAKISLNQFHIIWDKWIIVDEAINKHFELTDEFRENVKNMSVDEYKRLLSNFHRKQRFEINKKLYSLGVKTRDEQEKEENANMIMNGSYY